MPATVIPIKRSIRVGKGASQEAAAPDCPVCAGPARGLMLWVCGGCGDTMHQECYWGRVVTLDEWLSYLRWLSERTYPFSGGWPKPVVCHTCRVKKSEGV